MEARRPPGVSSRVKAKLKPAAKSYSVYFGGELFDIKHLLGNAYMAEAIYEKSHGKFLCHLPQDFELRGLNPHVIRDQDIIALFEADLAIFNFDGTELDSGTVVEFMLAKFADIPTVILRTDLRAAGDQGSARHDPWNLMASFYPRTEVVRGASLIDYRVLEKSRLRQEPEDITRRDRDFLRRAIETAIRAGGADEAVRCIVITGAGRGFYAGADMNGLQSIQASGGENYQASRPEVKRPAPSPLEQTFPGRFGHMFACPKPIIAAINGPCAGIGLILTLFADLRYAAAEAKFRCAYTWVGFNPDAGGTWLMPRLMGLEAAKRFAFTGDIWSAEQAQASGLVGVAGETPDGVLEAERPALAHPVAQQVGRVAGVAELAGVGARVREPEQGALVGQELGDLVVTVVLEDDPEAGGHVVGEGEVEQEVEGCGAPLVGQAVQRDVDGVRVGGGLLDARLRPAVAPRLEGRRPGPVAPGGVPVEVGPLLPGEGQDLLPDVDLRQRDRVLHRHLHDDGAAGDLGGDLGATLPGGADMDEWEEEFVGAGINFSPFYQSLHVYESLKSLDEFRALALDGAALAREAGPDMSERLAKSFGLQAVLV